MLDLLLPTRCAVCVRSGTPLCSACATSLPPAPDLAPPPGFATCSSLLSYEGTARTLVAALKFRRHLDAVGLLGAALAQLAQGPVDAVTWAPTSAARRRARGFDQAELLARAVARPLGLPCRATTRRLGSGSQTGRDRAHRLDGPAFEPLGDPPPRLLLVDDVRTTGATLCAAADALIGAGARDVHGLTLAVTL